MLSITKEPKNIPVSISLLHEQEYNNLCVIMRGLSDSNKKRRAYSERRSDKTPQASEHHLVRGVSEYRRPSLKN